MKIKICGLTRVCEAEYLNKNGVDMAGFVLFYEKSKRNIGIDDTRAIRRELDDRIQTVAVTVSPNLDQVRDIISSGFDLIQIHGRIPEGYFDIKDRIPVIKAFNLKDMDTYADHQKIRDIAGFVFDAESPGSGKTFDYNRLLGIERDENRLFILSGGLNADNVGFAIRSVRPDVVDVSSGVEYEEAGRRGKDPVRIASFVRAVREAGSETI